MNQNALSGQYAGSSVAHEVLRKTYLLLSATLLLSAGPAWYAMHHTLL